MNIILYSSCFKISKAGLAIITSRSGCFGVKPIAHTGYGIKTQCYTQAVLKFPKLNTQAQQREMVVQGRNLPPIPASV
ncbi:MAG: hypothetical protein LBJ00_15775 [Planctomycetaceae bacterium]|nr:hypothetical protein [Planctomycetaceae bacterium]